MNCSVRIQRVWEEAGCVHISRGSDLLKDRRAQKNQGKNVSVKDTYFVNHQMTVDRKIQGDKPCTLSFAASTFLRV